jgi:hypothetical protein
MDKDIHLGIRFFQIPFEPEGRIQRYKKEYCQFALLHILILLSIFEEHPLTIPYRYDPFVHLSMVF